MAVDRIQLPKGNEAVARVIDDHIDREESRNFFRRTMWLLSWYYLNGARRFTTFDPVTRKIQAHMLDDDGNLEFMSQELLSAIDRVSSQIAAMDLRPVAMRTGVSLGSIRSRAVSQILLDASVSENQLHGVTTEFASILTTLGCCGITGHVIDHPTIGLTADLEIVHPREVYAFPSLGQDYTKQRGIVRQRTVPMSWLQEKYGKKVSRNREKMTWWKLKIGDSLEHDDAYQGSRGALDRGVGGTQGLQQSDEEHLMGAVQIRECWMFGPRGLCDRYVITSGAYTIEDVSFDGAEVYCPLGWARFMETGTFYGSGLFDLLFSIHRQAELMLKSLFNNIRDADQYGILVIPQGQFNENVALRDVGRGLRVLPWDPDPIAEGFRPFPIQPFNMRDVPGKVAQLARDVMASINPWQDLLAEKGRADSAPALGFLDEKIKQLMNTPTRAVEGAFSQAYKHVLGATSRRLEESPRAIPVNQLTLDLAGAVIDAEKGEVTFDRNPLPSIAQVRVGIKETSPKSELVRKQEAIQLYQNMEGLQDPDAFRLFALQEGLDFAMWNEEARNGYESVVRNILLLFGDGDEPGEVIVTPHTAMPELQLRVLQAFMGGPVMGMASPDVQDAFMHYRNFLMDAMNMVLPAAVPNPDDLAALYEIQGLQGGSQMGQQPQAMLPGPQGGMPQGV